MNVITPKEKTIAIMQSNYIPWKGYFDMIHHVDEFVLFDDVQFTRRDWRNRNRIKTKGSLLWLTIPVATRGKFKQNIEDIVIDGEKWRLNHWETIKRNYSKTKHFNTYKDKFEILYMGLKESKLSECNKMFIMVICEILGISTKISLSTDYQKSQGKTQKLIDISRQCHATTYLSPPGSSVYLEQGLFEKENIKLKYMDYEGYPEYTQNYPPFEHRVSVIDLIFHHGPESPYYIWGWRDETEKR